MPPTRNKRPQDFTGRQSEALAQEHATELAERAKELGMIQAAENASRDSEVIDLSDARVPVTVLADEVEELSDDVQVAQDEFVTVRINSTLEQVTIGYGNTYNFEEGRKYRLPRHVAQHLDEKGFVWH